MWWWEYESPNIDLDSLNGLDDLDMSLSEGLEDTPAYNNILENMQSEKGGVVDNTSKQLIDIDSTSSSSGSRFEDDVSIELIQKLVEIDWTPEEIQAQATEVVREMQGKDMSDEQIRSVFESANKQRLSEGKWELLSNDQLNLLLAWNDLWEKFQDDIADSWNTTDQVINATIAPGNRNSVSYNPDVNSFVSWKQEYSFDAEGKLNLNLLPENWWSLKVWVDVDLNEWMDEIDFKKKEIADKEKKIKAKESRIEAQEEKLWNYETIQDRMSYLEGYFLENNLEMDSWSSLDFNNIHLRIEELESKKQNSSPESEDAFTDYDAEQLDFLKAQFEQFTQIKTYLEWNWIYVEWEGLSWIKDALELWIMNLKDELEVLKKGKEDLEKDKKDFEDELRQMFFKIWTKTTEKYWVAERNMQILSAVGFSNMPNNMFDVITSEINNWGAIDINITPVAGEYDLRNLDLTKPNLWIAENGKISDEAFYMLMTRFFNKLLTWSEEHPVNETSVLASLKETWSWGDNYYSQNFISKWMNWDNGITPFNMQTWNVDIAKLRQNLALDTASPFYEWRMDMLDKYMAK